MEEGREKKEREKKPPTKNGWLVDSQLLLLLSLLSPLLLLAQGLRLAGLAGGLRPHEWHRPHEFTSGSFLLPLGSLFFSFLRRGLPRHGGASGRGWAGAGGAGAAMR